MKQFLSPVFLMLAFLVACDPQETASDQSLDVGKSSVSFAASGSVPVAVTVNAVGVEWNCGVADEYDWISASKTDESTLTISVADNDTTQERTGKVTVTAAGKVELSEEILVTQAGGEAPVEYSLSVDPASLSFASENAEAQKVIVTTTGDGLLWNVETEVAAEWLHTDRVDGQLSVWVDDNSSEESRAVNLIIVPSEPSVGKKAVRVTQAGKVVPPSISVDPKELNFEYMPVFGQTVYVDASKADWNARTSTTDDGQGEKVEWIDLQVFNTAGNSSVLVTAQTNTTLEPRSGYVVISSVKSEVEEVYIPVTQEAGREFLTNLSANVEVTDMNGAGSVLEFIPTQEWSDATTAIWYLALWGNGLDFVTVEWPWSQTYYGSGSRFYMTIRSEAIKFNDDSIYYLPDGEYKVVPDDPDNKTPFTIIAGEASQNQINPRGGWYYGLESDKYVQAAPLAGGSMTVERSGDEYTMTFDFVDDAGFKITGSCVAEMKVKVISTPVPKPKPKN